MRYLLRMNNKLRTSRKEIRASSSDDLPVIKNQSWAKVVDLRLRTILNFSPLFRKFYTNIEIPFYFRKIFMFLPSQT